MKTANDNEGPKTEASYPVYDLGEAIKIAAAVCELGGNNAPVSRSLLAQHLKYAEKGPSFFQRVAASRAFGAIDGRGAYSLTELGRRYFYPTTENEAKTAAVAMITFPKAFSILVQKFDGGKLPPIEMVGNIIHSEAKIPVSKKNLLAGCFIRSAQFIGAIDSGGFLRCKALIAGGGGGVNAQNPPPPPLIPLPVLPPAKGFEEAQGTKTYELTLDKEGKRCVKVNAPLDITSKEVQRIAKWLEVQLVIEENGGNP